MSPSYPPITWRKIMLLFYLSMVVMACIVIWRACDGFEVASSYLGRNLSDGVRGATINAIGSSMPELLTTLIALLLYADKQGYAFGVATTAGSDIFNSAVIPGAVILLVTLGGIAPMISISKKVAWRDGFGLILGELLLIAVLARNEITWVHGLTLMGYYVLYMIYMFTTMSRSGVEGSEDEDEEPKPPKSRILALFGLDLETVVVGYGQITVISAWVLLILAVSFIGGACYVLVESCYGIGNSLGINTYFVAVILAAAATSVPDTILSLKDAIAGAYEDAVGNALGSNIFDICVCLGLPLFLFGVLTGDSITVSVANQASVAELRVFLLGHTILVFLAFILGRGMGALKGWFMMFLYATFVAFVIGRAYETEWAMALSPYLQRFLSQVVLPW